MKKRLHEFTMMMSFLTLIAFHYAKIILKKALLCYLNLTYFIFTADICDRTASWCEYSSGLWDGFRTLHVVWGANQFAKSMVALNSKFLKLNPFHPFANHLVTLFHFTYQLMFCFCCCKPLPDHLENKRCLMLCVIVGIKNHFI